MMGMPVQFIQGCQLDMDGFEIAVILNWHPIEKQVWAQNTPQFKAFYNHILLSYFFV